ncbi:unnamed protein product, partial [marine sediment metagenome]
METYEQRLKRFQNSSPDESISTLLNSIHNFFVSTELKLAAEQKLYYLLILGIHAVAKTISESIYGKSGLAGFRFYLEKFVDGNTTVLKFSNIAAELNTWRNILAHQWIAGMGHRWSFDDQMKEG